MWPFGADTPKPVIEMWDYKFNNTSGTCSASGPGVLGCITIGGGTLGLLTVYDNSAASGTNIIAQITAPSGGQSFWYNVRCKQGFAVFASAATSFTVTYQT